MRAARLGRHKGALEAVRQRAKNPSPPFGKARRSGPFQRTGPGPYCVGEEGPAIAIKRTFLLAVLAPGLVLAAAALKFLHDVHVHGYGGEARNFTIAPGEGFASVNGRLEREGLVKSAALFHRHARLLGLVGSLRAGTYRIEPGATAADLAELLTSGRSVTARVTVPEGKNLYQVAAILEEARVIESGEDFVALCKDEDFMRRTGVPRGTCEGYLYPDTYDFSPGSDPRDIIARMRLVFERRTRGLDLASSGLGPHEAVILASIVEKETGAPWERPRIAGVFHNRLARGMRLQSDPTTIYGIWERHDGNLRRSDLRERTPYNTYRIKGLPAGPIANPGLDSLKAALAPERHPFLYFVSKNDGTHAFSRTYEEHRRAVRRFQLRRSARKGKSWRDLDPGRGR